ncbi:MAG: hypothetical protein EBS39_12795 [Gammaproteobacteria bacterium]|nr:hypothetical protein [Gammaproteobacteria bacterium]
MSSSTICLGAILIIAMIVIAYFAGCRRKRHHRHHRRTLGPAERHQRDAFSYTTPATPRVQDAVADLFAALKHMVALGRSFEEASAPAALHPTAEVANARRSAAVLVRALDRAEKGLSGTPPTYANYLAFYRGLASDDASLLAAADAYTEAGRRALHSMAPDAHDSDVASLGNTLISMGGQLRLVVRAVHRLGAALDVE